MARIDQRLLNIAGKDISNIAEYEVQYNKLWKDADRNMAGEVRASLIGVFPKIKVRTTAQELSKVMSLGALLNTPFFSVKYFDIVSNTIKTADYYASDFSTKLLHRAGAIIDSIEFTLVPVRKA